MNVRVLKRRDSFSCTLGGGEGNVFDLSACRLINHQRQQTREIVLGAEIKRGIRITMKPRQE